LPPCFAGAPPSGESTAPANDLVYSTNSQLKALQNVNQEITAEIQRLQTRVDISHGDALPLPSWFHSAAQERHGLAAQPLVYVQHAHLTVNDGHDALRGMFMPGSTVPGALGLPQAKLKSTSKDGKVGVASITILNKRLKAALDKQLLERLDACIPSELRSAAQRKCAGKRSVGASGRSTIDILQDTIRSVAALRASGTNSSFPASSLSHCASSQTTFKSAKSQPMPMHCGLPFRESLFSADCLMCMEVNVLGDYDSSDWIINDLGCGAQNFYMHTMRGDVRGHGLKHFVHPDDMHKLLWLRREVGCFNTAAPCHVAQVPTSVQVRFINLSAQPALATQYITLTLKLVHLLDQTSNSAASAKALCPSVLLTGVLPPYVVEQSRQLMLQKFCFESELCVAGGLGKLEGLQHSVNVACASAPMLGQQDFRVSLDEQHISWLGSFAEEDTEAAESHWFPQTVLV